MSSHMFANTSNPVTAMQCVSKGFPIVCETCLWHSLITEMRGHDASYGLSSFNSTPNNVTLFLVVRYSLNFALSWSSVTVIFLLVAGRVIKVQNVTYFHEFLQDKTIWSVLFLSTLPLSVT